MQALLLAAASAAALNPSLGPVFGWRDGAVYAVTARPDRVTDIVLQPGETLSPGNPVAAGDTVRWIIGDSESGVGPARQVHLLVKPTAAGIATNLLIATDRRTYHVELRSTADAYMSAVSWRYPEGELVALKARPAPGPQCPTASVLVAPEPDVSALNFAYRIEGSAPFRPERVFDDGRRTVIDFPASIAATEMPPLFIVADGGGAPQLVNYRVQGRRMVVDRIFQVAELRLGAAKTQAKVRIVREKAPAQ